MRQWQDVPILPCEELVVVVGGPRVVSRSAYWEAGRYESALADIWLRRDVARRVLQAAQLLPPDLTLVLWDGWRPLQLQAELYAEYRDAIAADQGLTGEQLERQTRKFVSAPSPDAECPPPHLTGGAIDLTLGDESGEPLDMGGGFDELGPRSHSRYYERDDLTKAEIGYRDRRRLLCAVMAHAGFSNYEEEWWHFDCGNQFHHARVGGPARYGAVSELPAHPRRRVPLEQGITTPVKRYA